MLNATTLSFLISFILSLVLIFYGKKDIPNQRSHHKKPTSRNGGIAIIAAFFSTYIFILQRYPISSEMKTIIYCSYAIGVFGFLDDIFVFSWNKKLFFQSFIIFLYLILSETKLKVLPDIKLPMPFILSLILPFFWIIIWVNIFNFIDGINGLCSGISLLILGFIILFAPLMVGEKMIIYILASCILGFFCFNFPFGKIFLGDGGSLFLGLFLAQLSLHWQLNYLCFWIPTIFFHCIIDITTTLWLRWQNNPKSIFSPHKEFLFHQLYHYYKWHHGFITLSYLLLSIFNLLILKIFSIYTSKPLLITWFILSILYTFINIFIKLKVLKSPTTPQQTQ